MKTLVLIGGGHSHIEVLRRMAADPPRGTRLVLVSPHADTPYSGMLPGWIAGHYRRKDCHIDLARLCRAAGCTLLLTRTNGINPETKQVFCENGLVLPFDLASVDTGTHSPAFDTPGAPEHALAVKPVDSFMTAWEGFCVRAARERQPQRIVMVGAGAAGIEVLLAMQYRLSQAVPDVQFHFDLVGDMHSLLPAHSAEARALLARQLCRKGIGLHLGRKVARVEHRTLRFSGGGSLEGDLICWSTGALAPMWPRSAGLAIDARGFILVNEHLQSVSHACLFAAGDIATVKDRPRPKSGVYAVRAGPPLAVNLHRILSSLPLRAWVPQRRSLALITTGRRHAIASRGRLAVGGAWVWHWKDWIDRRFMKRYEV
jgi:selenide, water dikinase